MEQIAKLSLDKEQLEHLVERLQDETGMFCFYIYQERHLNFFFRNNWRLRRDVSTSETTTEEPDARKGGPATPVIQG